MPEITIPIYIYVNYISQIFFFSLIYKVTLMAVFQLIRSGACL